MRDAAFSIGFSFSGVSMDYSEDHFQLADVGIFYFYFYFKSYSLLGLCFVWTFLFSLPFGVYVEADIYLRLS